MWLAMDTATDRASVALGAPGVVFASETVVGARRHAAGLLPAIETCLARAGASFADLEGLVLADGPGSFTGLRVGASVIRGLHRVRRMPLWVAPSLLVCAAGGEGETAETVLAVSNALRGELFAAAYRFADGRVESVLAPTVLTPAAVRSRVPVPVRPVGPAAATLGGQPSWPDAAVLLAARRPGGRRANRGRCRPLGARIRPAGGGAGQMGTRAWTAPGGSGRQRPLTPSGFCRSNGAASAIPGVSPRSKRSCGPRSGWGASRSAADEIEGYLVARAVAGEGEILNLAVAPEVAAKGSRAPGCSRPASMLSRRPGRGRSSSRCGSRMSPPCSCTSGRASARRGSRPRYYRNPVEDAIVLRLALSHGA